MLRGERGDFASTLRGTGAKRLRFNFTDSWVSGEGVSGLRGEMLWDGEIEVYFDGGDASAGSFMGAPPTFLVEGTFRHGSGR